MLASQDGEKWRKEVPVQLVEKFPKKQVEERKDVEEKLVKKEEKVFFN